MTPPSESPKPVGRPRNPDRPALLQAFEQYIVETQIPIVAEFAAMHGLWRQRLHEWPEFQDAIKACLEKKEAALERQGLEGNVNVTMAIFSLKQLGWTDKQDVNHKGALPVKMEKHDGEL